MRRDWLSRGLLWTVLVLYTVYTAGPFVWVANMSLRTTPEIMAAPYAVATTPHWWKFVEAWTTSNYGTYLWNSVAVCVGAVVIVTIVGAMAAHALARYRFPGRRLVGAAIFSTIIFPPQITIIALFQIMVEYDLYDTRLGLMLVYVAIQLPLTVYLLEAFFARIPEALYEAAKIDGYGGIEVFWKITLPVGFPAIATTIILNFIHLWNDFLYAVVIISDDDKRTLPLGIQKFMGDQMEDIGMIATGMMIAVIPVVLFYAFFSERLIQGMTAGAVK